MCRDPLIRFTEDAMERAAGEFRAIHEAVVVLDYFKDLPDPRRLGKVTYPLAEWQYRAERRRSSIARGSARRRSVFSAGSGRFAMERLHTITPEIVKTIPGRRATLRSAGRGARVTSAGSGNIGSPRASRPFEERLREVGYAPCDYRCGREPGLPNRPQDRVCGSEGRGSERHRRLLGNADPRHFPRHHLSPRRPDSGPHGIRLPHDAAPLPARGGLRADRPLRGHPPLRTEPAARKRCRCFVEARFRTAAMPFP